MSSLSVTVPDGLITQVAQQSQLRGASRSQVLRFALLCLVMDEQAARNTVFSVPDDLPNTGAQVKTHLPDEELQLIKERKPEGTSLAELARFALANRSGHPLMESWDIAHSIKRGRPAGKTPETETDRETDLVS